MKRNILLAWAIISSFVISGCESLIPSHPHSFKIEGEKISIDVIKSQKQEGEDAKEFAAPIAAVVIPLVADYAVKKIAAGLEDESKKYTAVYTGMKPESGFYESGGPTPTVKFGGLRITRSVPINSAQVPAAEFKFKVDGSQYNTNRQLQLVGETAQVDYAKAKVADTRWYLPWTWLDSTQDSVDVDMNITIEGHWLDEKDTPHQEEIANLNLPLRAIKLATATDISKIKSEWFPLLPRTKLTATTFGTGTYVIKVKVTEYDDFGKRVKTLAEFVTANKDTLLNKLKDSLPKQ